ncbi:MAG: VCBS repeat-containing protein [Bacteroidales bacterium]|nr:VCBS repeat-containing protein [Bacteroidales bacterium]
MNFTKPLLKFFSVLAIFLSISSCIRKPLRFQEINSSHSGIHFNNLIIENDSVNQLDNGNVFNGGGVGIGDFNNDGFPDIFFTGNLVSCKLYLNDGDFSFKDVTETAGVTGEGKWCRGVAVVDINNDGFQDLYVSSTIWNDSEKRKNILYVNQGTDSRNIPHFKDMAAAYGLDDDSHTTQAAFFDYDNDGDLDVYLTVNEINDRNSPFVFRPVIRDGSNSSTGRLYRNDLDAKLKHPVFTNVSKHAGIQTEGYGNQASITDINQDGWKDIYVSNDYLMNDLLWINNRNGTFSERIASAFRHTSNSAMGNDASDINNDGLIDFITLDMNPEDNYRKKMMLPPSSYQFFQNSDRYGYSYQYTRNTLQLNQGSIPSAQDSSDIPVFSEIAYFAGVEATDWSWTPLLFDSDNDGYNDLFIANGFPKDITDHDFGMFRSKAWLTTPKADILKQVPEVKIHNYLYKNNADLTFSDKSAEWGLSDPTFSNGAAYADFDNDGDLDLVINNINDEASLYRNNSTDIDPLKSNYLHVKLIGDSLNRNGLGALIYLYFGNGKMQVRENNPYRGYISTSTVISHFGLRDQATADSLIIKWQSGKVQKLINVTANQLIEVNIKNADIYDSVPVREKSENALFSDVTGSVKISHNDKEEDFVDFNIQKLLPHKLSEYGPSLASGDIDGNGLDDIVTGGSAKNSAMLFLQKSEGTFTQRQLLNDGIISSKKWDDMGILLFDADGDGDKDLYVSSGGYENESGSKAYQDHFYINNGKGIFTERDDVFPENFTSKACVRAADFDRDNDLDLFISGRVDPWNYPKPVSSYLFRNDSDNGTVKFTDITKEVAPMMSDLGMVCDALFTDYNNDGWSDLVLAGEWMPVTFLKNVDGKFINATNETGTVSLSGWWNSITSGDFDNDSDIDYVVGNLGLNSFYRASEKHPVSIISGDFDNNGNYDAFPALYITSSQTDTSKKAYPAFGRDDAVKQMIKMRSGFQNYKSYAIATIDKLFTENQFNEALKLKATEFRSSLFRNDGNGKFSVINLPAEAQLSAVNGMVADDFDEDGNIDLLINTNDYSTDVLTGRYDALSGLFLKGNGNGEFTPLSISESGVYVPGNGKALVKLRGAKGNYLVAASQNRGPVKIFELNAETDIFPLRDDDISAEIRYKDGKVQRQEFYYGNSFLSQSARFLKVGRGVKEVTITNSKGLLRRSSSQ